MKKIGLVMAMSLGLPATAAQADGPTAPQIAATEATPDTADIHAAKPAMAKSHSKDVREFGQRMITDHKGVNKSAVDLVTKLKVMPEDNATSQSLKSGGEQNLHNLKMLKHAAFDKAYLDHEVAYHEQVLA